MKIEDIIIGEVKFVDDGDIGISIHGGKSKLWLNELGTDALYEWLKQKKENSKVE